MEHVKNPKRDLYDVEEYKQKLLDALVKLESDQQPGERGGKGGKQVVLQAAQSEISLMLEKGYTAKQIAAALKAANVFAVAPKSITQAAGIKHQAGKTTGKRKPLGRKPTEPATSRASTQPSVQPNESSEQKTALPAQPSQTASTSVNQSDDEQARLAAAKKAKLNPMKTLLRVDDKE